MFIYEIHAIPIEQQRDLHAFERQIATFAVGRTYPYRLLAYSQPFAIQRPLAALEARRRAFARYHSVRDRLLPQLYRLLAGSPGAQDGQVEAVMAASAHDQQVIAGLVPDRPAILHAPDLATQADWMVLGERIEQRTWVVPVVREMERMLDTDMGQYALRSAQYFMVVWPPPDVQAGEILGGLHAAFRTEVCEVASIPSCLRGAVTVRESQAMFTPQVPGQPYLSVLRAHAIMGEIDAGLLHPLMALPFNLTIAVDVDTLPADRARRVAEFAYQAARAATMDARVKDTRSEDKLVDAERVMREAKDQSLHGFQIAVLVEGDSEEQLRERRAAVRDLLGGSVRFEAVRGSQAEFLKLFSTTPPRAIDAAWSRVTQLSHAAGCLLGVYSYHRASNTDGPLWGIDPYRSSPLFYDLFHGGKAGHTIVLGQTGSGKTFFMNVLTLRAAATMGWRVIWIDSNENGPRIERACREGCRRYEVGPGTTLNLMDPVYGPEDGPNWAYSQIEYVISSLAMLLGTPESSGGDVRGLTPRVFSPEERGYLERALLDMYQSPPEADASEADASEADDAVAPPVLTDLILSLEALNEARARRLATSLRMLLFGSESRMDTQTLRGACFNGATSTDWDLESDVTFFDLSQSDASDKSLLPFRYAHIIGSIYRYMRNPKRDRRRPTLLIIDEFGLASRIEAVGKLAETITRVARKYGLALLLADQTPNTFLETAFGRVILDNSPVKVIFHLDERPTQEIGSALPILTPSHLAFIQQADQGFCMAVFDSYAAPMQVVASDREKLLLTGS